MSSTTNLNPPISAPLRSVSARSRVLAFWDTMIGKKIVMAVTGAIFIAFVIAHMIGNLKIFHGPEQINAYSRFLREVGWPALGYGELLWMVRIVLLVCVILHATAAYQLSRMSWAARPLGYRVRRDLETTFSSRMMRWGGVLLLVFIVFHLLHLTVGAVGFKPGQFHHLAAYQNVLAAFSIWPIAAFYIVAMAALCLHLDHGIWSMLQTLGWSNARNERTLKVISRAIAIVVFVGFSSVPLAVMAGRLH